MESFRTSLFQKQLLPCKIAMPVWCPWLVANPLKARRPARWLAPVQATSLGRDPQDSMVQIVAGEVQTSDQLSLCRSFDQIHSQVLMFFRFEATAFARVPGVQPIGKKGYRTDSSILPRVRHHWPSLCNPLRSGPLLGLSPVQRPWWWPCLETVFSFVRHACSIL